MEAFEYGEILAGQRAGEDAYVQFINRGSMSLGLYVLPAGSQDAPAYDGRGGLAVHALSDLRLGAARCQQHL